MTDVTSMMPPYELFLTDDEVARLTGRNTRPAQGRALRKMNIPFFVNATGRAIIARAAVEGRSTLLGRQPTPGWSPSVLGAR